MEILSQRKGMTQLISVNGDVVATLSVDASAKRCAVVTAYNQGISPLSGLTIKSISVVSIVRAERLSLPCCHWLNHNLVGIKLLLSTAYKFCHTLLQLRPKLWTSQPQWVCFWEAILCCEDERVVQISSVWQLTRIDIDQICVLHQDRPLLAIPKASEVPYLFRKQFRLVANVA